MATLTGSTVASTYTQLLKLTSEGIGDDASAKYIEDGLGTDSALSISTTRVGIGTAAPSTLLHVAGDTANGSFLSYINNTGSQSEDNGLHIQIASSGSGALGFKVQTGGAANAFIVAGDGQVGIGYNASSLAQTLNVNGGAYISGNVGIGITPLATFHAKMASDVNFTLSANSGDLRINAVNDAVDTAVGLEFNAADFEFITGTVVLASAQTSGKYLNMEDTTLTTGNLIQAYSNASNASTRSLVKIVNDHVDATGTTGLKIQQDSTGASIDAGGYMVNEQGRQNHVANTMSSPYYRFDGVDDKVEVADNANLDFATNDFTTEALVRIPSGVASRTIIGKSNHTTSTNEGYSMECSSNGKLSGRIIGANTRVIIGDSSKTIADGLWHHVCITFDRSASATVYIDGVADGTTSISGASGDASNSYPFQIATNDQEANFAEMEVNHARVFNNLLSAAEVKELYSGASVPYKYKGANQTNIFTGAGVDFSTDAVNKAAFDAAYNSLGWFSYNTPDDVVVASNTMTVTATATSNGLRIGSNITDGKSARITFNVSAITGTWFVATYESGFITHLEVTSTGTVDGLEITDWASDSSLYLISNDASAHSISIDASSINNVMNTIGAVAEYDGSGVASDKWFDKSGNDLHGTVSGATVENAPTGDDGLVYEEGYWTAVANSGGTLTIDTSYDQGSYTRIGNQVTCQGQFQFSAESSPSGDLYISGLPYEPAALTEDADVVPATVYAANLVTAVDGGVTGYAQPGGDNLYIRENGLTGWGNDMAAHFDTGSYLLISITYVVT